ncbi:uncharacterized protein RCC_05420 [Ramularia collo-cygni]|uniref:C2H2 type master regulator of conidiophore development brlA n=1 Tax=Ramularia collo-cygni TaxID=112498 RepID=A0A2D3VD34_9PEZI|nr:uncharacterized protein RCC_05420 [Ramularia collo-cygni]CZT19569.1 uncharacterized protein RCC_05420 [Ramularia collo-cygni]
MEELNFVGSSFEELDCEQYYNQLAASDFHTATCLTPWEPPDLCIDCFVSIASNDAQLPASGLYGAVQNTVDTPAMTYAQVAAFSSLVEPTPVRRPWATSDAETARPGTHSQPRPGPVFRRSRPQGNDPQSVIKDSGEAVPVRQRASMTYAEVAQHFDEQDELDGGFGSRSLYTSTENSLGLPNQNICCVSKQSPYRTSRSVSSRAAPYSISQVRRQQPRDVCIPTLSQQEHNFDPRNPYTLVQRTTRGGHRDPVSADLTASESASPLSCGTLSTISAASRSRRKEVQDRPHPCLVSGCLWRFVNPKDLKRHQKTHAPGATPAFPCPYPFCIKSFTRHDNRMRHVRSEHADDSGLGTSASSSEYASVSHSSFPLM